MSQPPGWMRGAARVGVSLVVSAVALTWLAGLALASREASARPELSAPLDCAWVLDAAEQPVPVGPAGGGAAEMGLSIFTDQRCYRVGDPVLVTIVNSGPQPVYAPPRGGCVVVTAQRWESEAWAPLGECPTLNVSVVAIAPHSTLSAPLVPAPPPLATEPVVLPPVAPASGTVAVRNLPTATPWQPGDPVREIPEGATAPPFSVLGSLPGPGAYRIQLVVTIGSPSGPVSTVYSETFLLLD